jgi:hypothetical protein
MYQYPEVNGWSDSNACLGDPTSLNEVMPQYCIPNEDDYAYGTAQEYFSWRNYVVTNDDDDNLSGGAIAGIVIGVFVFLGIFAAIIYFFFLPRKSPMSTQEPRSTPQLSTDTKL